MRVTLIHNPTSGYEQLSEDELIGRLQQHGYEADYYSSKTADLAQALNKPEGLVVVAGGDGTIGKIAPHLAERDTDVAVLALGTANNVATTLAALGHGGQEIAAWRSGRRKSYDAGLATGPWGQTMFLEAAGFGIFARLIAKTEADKKKQQRSFSQRENEIRHALGIFKDTLNEYRVCACRVTLDGEDYSGRYLSLEVMNIRSIGPNVEVAPRADPGDGLFDVVFFLEHDRQALLAHVEQRLAGEASTFKPTIRRARHVTISALSELEVHIDDDITAIDGSATMEIRLQPGALRFV